MPSIETQWARIETWLAASAPLAFEELGVGATREAITAAEAAMFLVVPDDLRASWTRHATPGWFFLGHYLASPRETALAWRARIRMSRNVGAPLFLESIGPVRESPMRPGWIPFGLNDNVSTLVLDLDPAEGGVVGQIVRMSEYDNKREVVAPSLAYLLGRVADELEAGAYVEDHGFLDRTLEEEWTYEQVADEIAALAKTAPRPTPPTLPTTDGSDLRPGAIVTATVSAWDHEGLWLVHGRSRLHVWLGEISPLGNVHVPDPKVAKVGDILRVKVLEYRPEDVLWWSSLSKVDAPA